MILEVMEVKWRSKRGRIDTAMAYSENMGKNRVVCKKDPQSVENCDREPPPPLKCPRWNAPSPFRFSARLLRIKLKLGTYYILTNYLGYSLFQSLFVFRIPMPPDSGRKKDGVWCEVKAAENDQKKVVCMHCDGMI